MHLQIQMRKLKFELATFGVHKTFGASLWDLLFIGIRSAQSSLLTLLWMTIAWAHVFL